jgi:hypothetical protein
MSLENLMVSSMYFFCSEHRLRVRALQMNSTALNDSTVLLACDSKSKLMAVTTATTAATATVTTADYCCALRNQTTDRRAITCYRCF